MKPASEACPCVELSPSLRISRLVIGLWQVADLERPGGLGLSVDAALEDLHRAYAAGLTSFDMADHYGSAEELMARCPDFQAFTKWVPKPGPAAGTSEAVDAAVQVSLNRMQRTKLDLMQFHTWDYLDGPGVWLEQLRMLQQHPSVSNLGLTNVNAAHLQLALASGANIVSNQICCSLLDRRFVEGSMTEVCKRGGVKLLAFGVLAGGLLTDRYLGRGPPTSQELAKSWSVSKYYRFVQEFGTWELFQELLGALRKVADRHDVSIANVSTRWVLEQEAVAAVIIGARLGHGEHVDENKRVFNFALTAEDHAEIASVCAQSRPIPGDCGDEYRREPFLTASGDLRDHLDQVPLAFTPIELPGHTGANPRLAVSSGLPTDKRLGSSRAVRHGSRILVSGTTATNPRDGSVVCAGSALAQTTFALDLVEAALKALGGSLSNVTRTRLYVRSADDWKDVAWAHSEHFKAVCGPGPASTLVRAEPIGAAHLVEVEAEAEIPTA